LSGKKKILYILPKPVNLRIVEKSSVLPPCCFSDRSEIMSSQDSEGESYVADYIADPKSYGDVEHYGWTTDEEEDHEPKGKEETSSDEEDDPLPQPGDMHVEFKKSSLPNKAKKPNIQFIPSKFLLESKGALCKRVLKLEQENEDLREENFALKCKFAKLAKPPSPKET
jgi:hypothetical protein